MNVSAIQSKHGLTAGELLPKAAELTPQQRAKASQLKGAALRSAEPAAQRAAVAAQFEAILVRQMLGNTMTSMMGQGGGAASSVYGDLLTDTISQKLAGGSGMGLARLIERQLAPRGSAESASKAEQ